VRLRPGPHATRELQAAAIAVLASIAVGSILMLVDGVAPGRVWWAMIAKVFANDYWFGEMLFATTGIALCGIAVGLALDAGMFNIGTEGQLTAGVLGCATVGAALPAGTPGPIAVPLCLVAAGVSGAAVGALIGAYKAYRGAHEVITSIMLNVIIAGVALWLGNELLFENGTTTGAPIAEGAHLPQLGLGGSHVNATLVLAIGLAGLVWWLRSSTTWGEVWRTVGREPAAARIVGISVQRVQVLALTASGALAGLAAANVVLGYKHAYEDGLGRGTGLLGVSAGLLGRSHPGGILAASLLLGFLQVGGLAVGGMIPKELTEMLQGVVVLAVACSAAFVARRTQREGA
jgi:simple sugar transport system permease protein